MRRVPMGMLVVAVVVSLLAGGITGFFLGIASTKAAKKFLEDLVEQESPARTDSPKKLARDRFELLYPANWKIDVADEDHDPDHMFSIDSPGSSFVLFVLGEMETDPAESLQEQIEAFSKFMGKPAIQPFSRYGKLHGKGAILRGKIMGMKVTVKAFACYSQGMTAVIVQQGPDEDMQNVKGGLELVEQSFVLKPK